MSDKKSILAKFADKYEVDANNMLSTLKQTAFRQSDGKQITNEQMIALLIVADQYDLNPFTREIYAFPDKGRIVPVVGVDGWSRIINNHENFDGMKFSYSEDMETPEGAKPCHVWVECGMYRKDRSHPISAREYLDEVYRPPYVGRDNRKKNGPWQTHTKRMIRHKATIQAARLAFGFVGIFDEDEAQRIIEKDVTPIQYTQKQVDQLHKCLEHKEAIGLAHLMSNMGDLAQEQLFRSFPDGRKHAMKQEIRELEGKGWNLIAQYASIIKDCVSSQDLSGLMEIKEETSKLEMDLLKGKLTEEEMNTFRNVKV